jgi:hypothetical protein
MRREIEYVVRGVGEIGRGIGNGREGIYRATERLCDLLASRTGACNKRGGVVEKAPDDAVHSVAVRNRGRSG